MAAASGERALAFTAQELEKLVDGVLPQYTLLYGPPDQQVSTHQKKDSWRAIAKDVQTLGVHQRQGTHCRKRWEGIRRWSKKTAEAQLGMASQRGRGARCTMTPLMFRILAVAYPELDGRLRASQQTQGGEYNLILGTWHAVEGLAEGGGLWVYLSLAEIRRLGPSSRRSASAKKPPVPVVRVTGVWSAPATRAGSVTQSQGTASPPPVKALKLESDCRDRVKTPGGKTTHRGPRGIAESAVTPPKVGKGPKKSAQPGVSITAEKGGILPSGRDATVVTGQETTARVIAQEGTSIVTGPTSIVTGQETTARVSAQEGTSIVTGQETTAGVIAQEGTSIVTGQETTAGVSAQEGPGSDSPAGQ
ncbi:hypothetical protein NDU88_010055 [Pleurodeles waltl]|uniref:Myb/SANT-like DNA-binding domain-containing protein n=1 Tax=Pleurodeles waltl TaxID=8319 RepID=A0AAV7RX00_PLEWA|nr:hypothetical protein NDU88_010055 [Pleurodeles waltl]